MKHSILIALSLISILVISCDGSKDNPKATTSPESNASNSISAYKSEIEMGLIHQFYLIHVPVGEVTVMGEIASKSEETDREKKYMKYGYLAALDIYKKMGLLTYTEGPYSELEQLNIHTSGTWAERRYNVVPLKKATDAKNAKLSSPTWVVIESISCEIDSIVKDEVYSHPRISANDSFRLVMGTFKIKNTEFSKTIGTYPESRVKFRAVLKLNPFTKKYVFQIADQGPLDSDTWESNNIP